MRKRIFYPKLALNNLWRNRGTYAPYLLACVISVFTFYTMIAIRSNGALDGIRGEWVVRSFTGVGSFVLLLFCGILIFYTNSFLIKRRKKELGLYSILGMEKKNIGFLLAFETLFIAVLALALGLGLGVLLSRLLFLVLLRLVRFDVNLAMHVSLPAMGLTVQVFVFLFLLTLLSNLRQVRMANPVDLMAGSRQGEREPKASLLLTIVGILCLGGGYFIALYFQSPMEVILLFFVAVFLVIIGTYCLFTSGSIAVLKLMRKNRGYYYQPRHFITVSGMIYRMKQNAAGLATICILSCMVLVTVSATVSLNIGMEDALYVQYPFAYEMRFNAYEDGDILLGGAREIAEDTGNSLVHIQDYRKVTYAVNEKDGVFVEDNNSAVTTLVCVSPLEDYNRSEGKNASLAPGEALLFVTGGRYDRDAINLAGISYSVTPLDAMGNKKAGGADMGRTIELVVPDLQAVEQVMAVYEGEADTSLRRLVAFDLAGSDQARADFEAAYQSYIGSISTQKTFQFRSREEGRDDWYATNGGFLFLGIYFGILFLFAAALIIYYKQISEGYDDADRYDILQKVGMSGEEVRETINGQILAVFFLPLLVAVVHIFFAFWPITKAMVLFSVINIPLLAACTVGTILIYAALYLLVFRKTAKTYFRIVRRESAA